jgi:hypothetical protein
MSRTSIVLLKREALMTTVLDSPEAQTEQTSKEVREPHLQLIPTPFGKLTEAEIRQWEEMLGHPLRRW